MYQQALQMQVVLFFFRQTSTAALIRAFWDLTDFVGGPRIFHERRVGPNDFFLYSKVSNEGLCFICLRYSL